jgi:hypothetical protein
VCLGKQQQVSHASQPQGVHSLNNQVNMQMSNQEHQLTGVTPSNPDGSITITPAIWAKMQTLLALLPEQQDVAKSIALPPDKPSTSLLASLPASPADDSCDPADVPPSEALDEKESDINDSLPNSNRSGNANEDVSAPSFININRDPIPDNNLISNKPDSVADKAPSPPGNTAPLKVISNIEGYKYTTVGQFFIFTEYQSSSDMTEY